MAEFGWAYVSGSQIPDGLDGSLQYKKGNETRDELADEGVVSINGKGLVRLAKWMAERHINYMQLMKWIHSMIIPATVTEIEERL